MAGKSVCYHHLGSFFVEFYYITHRKKKSFKNVLMSCSGVVLLLEANINHLSVPLLLSSLRLLTGFLEYLAYCIRLYYGLE